MATNRLTAEGSRGAYIIQAILGLTPPLYFLYNGYFVALTLWLLIFGVFFFGVYLNARRIKKENEANDYYKNNK